MLLFAAKNRPFTEIVCRNRKITARNRFRAIDEPKYLSNTGPPREWPRQPKQSGRAARPRAMRTCPSPEGPKLAPGVTTTPAFSMSSSQKRHGIGATTGKLGPHKHRAMRVGTLPAHALKTVAQGIAALLVLQTLRLDLIARTVQAGDSSLLDREEHAKVDLAAQLGKGRDHILAADQKPIRAPVTLNDLESEKNSRPPRAHRDTVRSCRRARRRTRCRSTHCHGR